MTYANFIDNQQPPIIEEIIFPQKQEKNKTNLLAYITKLSQHAARLEFELRTTYFLQDHAYNELAAL